MSLIKTCSLFGLIVVFNVTFLPRIQSMADNIPSFKRINTLKGHRDIVGQLKMLSNGTLISGSADTTMRIWNMDGVCLKCLHNHAEWINTVQELLDGRIACGSNEGVINLWDLKNDVCISLNNLNRLGSYGNSFVPLNNNTIAFTTWKKTIKIWDLERDVCLKTIDAQLHKAWISSLIRLQDLRHLVTSSWDSTIKIWDVSQEKFQCECTLEGHTDCVNVIIEFNDQTLVSAADDSTIRLWDIQAKKCKAIMAGHNDKVYTLLAANGKIVSGSRDKTVKIWDPELQCCLATIACDDKIYSLAFCSEKNYLFVGLGHGEIEVFQLFF